MPNDLGLNPLTLTKFVLWLVTAAIATALLTRRKMSSRLRLGFPFGGTVLFGFGYSMLLAPGPNPNPPSSVRSLLKGLLVQQKLLPPILGMVLILLGVAVVSNKTICGYGCQLGLLQDLLHRALPAKWRHVRWQPPFWLSNSVRGAALLAVSAGLALASVDWIGIVDPFEIFRFTLTGPIAATARAVLVASVFVYRLWCRFLCPFGFLSWVGEQFSIFRPRVNRDACKSCQACVRACPSGAMKDFYAGKALHADCFACGACIEACKVTDALGWRRK